jgi:ABC-type branched-subunit amino acid transport system substrate-binding protein
MRRIALRRGALVLGALAALLAAGCGDDGENKTATIVVDAPFSKDPYIGETIANGVKLAASDLGVERGDVVDFKVVTSDNAGSPSRAVANIRRAVNQGASAIITDGTGVDAGWEIANAKSVPIGIVYDGDEGLVDPEARPNVFRIAPSNHGMAFRYAEYLIPKGVKVALLSDDTGYGRGGRASLERAFSENPEALIAKIQIPSSASDLAPQVLKARRSGATGLLVWGQPASIAEAVVAARGAGWDVPIYASPSAQDPLVRQELASKPEWLNGLTFTSGRLTAEGGVGPYYSFNTSYNDMFGPQEVGVQTPDGKEVIQPPEPAMYAYDFTNVLATAIDEAGSTDAAKVLRALNQVSTGGANGDNRGFNEANHEGVVDDDVYFAEFDGMTFKPVKDDALSSRLPTLLQEP